VVKDRAAKGALHASRGSSAVHDSNIARRGSDTPCRHTDGVVVVASPAAPKQAL